VLALAGYSKFSRIEQRPSYRGFTIVLLLSSFPMTHLMAAYTKLDNVLKHQASYSIEESCDICAIALNQKLAHKSLPTVSKTYLLCCLTMSNMSPKRQS
jgi:hypothetical protein